MVPTVAFDIDLHRIHGYSTFLGRVCYNSPTWPWDVLRSHKTILVEVASPVDTSKKRRAGGQAHNRRKWAIGNSIEFGKFIYHCESVGILDRVRVSSADRWTLSYEESIREVIAGCSKQDNHDIRACRCMIHFYQTNPEKWLPVNEWYAQLSKKRKSK